MISGTGTITTPNSPTSGLTGLAGACTFRWTISNAPCAASTDDVLIGGGQVWAAANINVGVRINGAPSGQNMTAPGGDQKYCYNDVEANCTTYGGLYEWGEAMNYAASVNCDPCGGAGVQGICPAGFHIPTDLEWSRYEYCLESTVAPTGAYTFVNFQTVTSYRGTAGATGPAYKMVVGGSNTSGFGALYTGYRHTNGTFAQLGAQVFYWTATDYDATYAWYRWLAGDTRWYRNRTGQTKLYGFPVRCLQD